MSTLTMLAVSKRWSLSPDVLVAPEVRSVTETETLPPALARASSSAVVSAAAVVVAVVGVGVVVTVVAETEGVEASDERTNGISASRTLRPIEVIHTVARRQGFWVMPRR